MRKQSEYIWSEDMGRLNVYLSDDTERRLRDSLKKTHGSHRALSIVVEQAINEHVDRTEGEERPVESETLALESSPP